MIFFLKKFKENYIKKMEFVKPTAFEYDGHTLVTTKTYLKKLQKEIKRLGYKNYKEYKNDWCTDLSEKLDLAEGMRVEGIGNINVSKLRKEVIKEWRMIMEMD